MATAVMAGVAVFSAAGGVAAGTTAVAWGMAAAAGMAILDRAMQPDAPDSPTSGPVTLGDKGTNIDKSRMQDEADIGKLKLGEDDEKKKRKKGKAAFKIELDKQNQEQQGQVPESGVQVNTPEQQGVHI